MDLISDESEGRNLVTGRSYFTVSLLFFQRFFCNSFLALFCFSVLNAAETAARVGFLEGASFQALAQRAPQH